MQQVFPPTRFELDLIKSLDATAAVASARTMIESWGDEHCDVSIDPPFSARVIVLGDQDQLLVWSIHHIVSDGTSISLLFRELWRLYAEGGHESTSALAPMPYQYSDYLLWQRSAQRDWSNQFGRHWQERLEGAVGIRWPWAALLADATPGKLRVEECSLGRSISAELRGMVKQRCTSLPLALLAAYAVSIYLTCAQSDFVLTTVVNGRDLPAHEALIGYLAHNLFIRAKLRIEQTLLDLLETISKEYSRALQHKDFGELVRQRPLLLSRTLFQWFPWKQHELDGAPTAHEQKRLDLIIEPFDFRRAWTLNPDYDLVLVASEPVDELKLAVCYRPEVHNAATMRALMRHFTVATEALASEPTKTIAALAASHPKSIDSREAPRP